MFTLFALPKAFSGHTAVIQRNALGSWVRLRPHAEVVLFGDDAGVAEAARQFGVRHVPTIVRNEFGTPLVSDLFERAASVAAHDILCYTNADIIFTWDLPEGVAAARRWRADFLLAGRRFNLDLHEPIAFEEGWDRRLRARAQKEADLQDEWWIDYFVFRRGTLAAMPPFAIGRPAWDNWLIYHARHQRIPVIDATGTITAIHQRHDYRHVPEGTGDHWRGPESDRNLALTGGVDCTYNLLDASHRLVRGRISRFYSLQPARRRLRQLAASPRPVGRVASALIALARRMGRGPARSTPR
jgi:hypothetical protein